MKPIPALRRRRDDALIAVALAALAALLALSSLNWRADRLVYDAALSMWARPTPTDIVIVAIDDRSIEAIGRWPWSRAVHATLLERLAAARPRAIALDLVLSEPEPAGDPWLAAALQRAHPVVMPVAWQAVDGRLNVLQPTPALRAQAAALGAAESAVDADGVLRHLFLQAGPATAPFPHLALALLQAGGDEVHPSLAPETSPGADPDAAGGWRRDGRLLLRFAGPPGSMHRVSYVDVLQGRVPDKELAGRYLLIGMTAQGLGDTLATPVNASHRAMPGIEVLANAAAMLRDGGGVRELPPLLVAAIASLLLAALVFAFRRLGPRWALPLALGSVPLAALASLVSVRVGWTWSPWPYAVPALLAYPLWSWRRLEHAMRVLGKEIRSLAGERFVDAPPPAAIDAGARERDPLALRLRELARAGQTLREARQFLADALEGLPTAMLVGDAQGRVALANARAAQLFEVEQGSDLEGLDLARLVSEFRPRTELDWAEALAVLQPGDPPLSVEVHLACAELLVHLAAVEQHQVRRLIVSVADLAPVREAQRQREETLAFVTHDLRGPASSMVMLADLAAQGRSPLPESELLPEMRRLAARTLALADDFVHAAHAQTRPLALERVDPDQLVREALADAQTLAASAQVELKVRVEGDRGVTVDRSLVMRAVANLVSNALKHAPSRTAVDVHAWRDHAGLCIEVTDAGPGMAPDQREALLRGEDALRVGGPGGVGLGLVFVRRVARRHGGSLSAAPGPHDRGERLTLRLADQTPESGNP